MACPVDRKTKAKSLRTVAKFVFATVDVDNLNVAGLVGANFPLVSPAVVLPPRIIAFKGKKR